jgi:uncharacterized membrane protein
MLLEANVTTFRAVLMFATFLCSLVAGFLFAFAVVVMPGIRSLDDSGFIRAFQVIDRVIQNNQPLFVLVWVGSVFALIAAAVLGMWTLSGAIACSSSPPRFSTFCVCSCRLSRSTFL